MNLNWNRIKQEAAKQVSHRRSCPFCGSGKLYGGAEDCDIACVECKGCGGRGAQVHLDDAFLPDFEIVLKEKGGNQDKAWEELWIAAIVRAWELWNKRAEDKRQDEKGE
jgi:hypothetical protein